ncbi:MAG: hypothetical protein M0Q42_00335 [Xanthomonadales bacterium]|nr:hypothetical protein [Xanthomonadales bacterium]
MALIELALVLAILAVTGALAWSLLAQMRPTLEQGRIGEQLDQAALALQGFALVHHRLPCPDLSGDGRQGDGDGVCPADVDQGGLPWRDLGLSRLLQVRYGVHRSGASGQADLVQARERYTPALPTGILPLTPLIDGMDFCVALGNALVGSGSGLADGVAAAFVLAYPGAGDGDGFDQPAGFSLPGAPASATADIVRAVGPGELAARLECPYRRGQIDGAARALAAATDLVAHGDQYVGFRQLAYDIREMNVRLAEATLELAIADQVIALAVSASGIALAAVSGGVGAAAQAAAAAAVAAAAGALIAAGIALHGANSELTAAGNLRNQAIAYRDQARQVRLRAQLRLQTQHGAGLRP